MVLTITRHSPSTFTWFTLAGEEISRAGFDGDPDITDAEFELNSKSKTFKITDIAGNVTEGTYEISDRAGDLTDLWLGSKQYDDQSNAYEYLAYHFKKQTGGAQVESFTGKLSYSDTGWAFLEISRSTTLLQVTTIIPLGILQELRMIPSTV